MATAGDGGERSDTRRRQRKIFVRVTDAEHEAATRAAKAAGMSVGEWLRALAFVPKARRSAK